MYEIQYRRSVKNDLKKLPLDTRRKVVKDILSLANNPRQTGYSKLSGLKNTYRIRKGAYRIIYSIENKALIIIIIRVGHRKDIYRNL